MARLTDCLNMTTVVVKQHSNKQTNKTQTDHLLFVKSMSMGNSEKKFLKVYGNISENFANFCQYIKSHCSFSQGKALHVEKSLARLKCILLEKKR